MASVQLVCCEVEKTYGSGPLAQRVLTGVSMEFEEGQKCAVVGPSGSGKTTLLSILGCMLSPSGGQVTLGGRPINFESTRNLVELRRTSIGFVFQHAQLLPFLSIRENLRIVGRNCGIARSDIDSRILEVAQRLRIDSLLHKKPAELSGGQRQRAAIARAVLHRPRLLLADEPTAALDWENGVAAVKLLVEQASLENSLLITVTHDTRLLPHFDRVLRIEGGRIFES